MHTFAEFLSQCYKHVKEIYINTRFTIQNDKWELLHPRHFANVLLKHHGECKEILGVITTMKPGLTLKRDEILTGDISDNSYTPDLSEYFATTCKSEGTSKSIQINNILNIFQPFKNNDGSTTTPRFILIESAPGMGKTILCKEIAYQWAQQFLLDGTKLMFLLHLDDPAISNLKYIKDLVHYFYAFDPVATKLSEQCAEIINERDGKDITILFDGFDEFNSSSDSLITKILDCRVLPQCRIVVTSRLTASDKLRRMAYVRIQVMRFTDESEIQYIKQELKDYPDKINKLQSYLNNHESIKSICSVPIMMTILVYVFKEKGKLPNNWVELYEKFVTLTISCHLQKPQKLDNLFVSLETLTNPLMFDLSKFAISTLQSKQQIFSKKDINKHCPGLAFTSSDLDNLGIINSVQYFSTDKRDTHVFNFLHLSICDYLAAYYISRIDQYSQFSMLKSTFFNEKFQGTWTMFMAMNTNLCLNIQNFSVYCKEAHYDKLKEWIADLEPVSLFDYFIQLHDVVNSKVVSSDVMQILVPKDENKALASRQHLYLSLCSAEKSEVELFVIDGAIKDVFTSDWFMLCITLLNNGYSTVLYTGHTLILNKVKQQQMVDIFRYDISIEYMVFNYYNISESILNAINFSAFNISYDLKFSVALSSTMH